MTDKELTITVKEGESVSLKCAASGQPKPLITWRREDRRPIAIDGTSYNMVEANELNISRVSRENLGQYVCVANNGIPPAAVKRVNLFVTFPPLVKIAHSQQIIGASKGGSALLQCYIEAYPEPFVEWIFGEARVLVEGGRLNISEEVLDWRLGEPVSRRALLTVSGLAAEDYGTYRCQARNNRGRTYGIVSLIETDAKKALENDTLKKNSFVYYGEMPKHIEKKTQCEPCPDCVASSSPTFAGSDEQQCKVGRKAIVSMGVPVYFNYTQLNKRTTECYLSQIGKPVFNGKYGNDSNTSQPPGCWMRDPKPVKPEDREKYWLTLMESTNLLQEFASKEAFRNKAPTVNYTLLHRFTGNAQTIYSGKFYYAGEGTNKVVILSLDTLDTAFVTLMPASSTSVSISTSSLASHHHNLSRRPMTTTTTTGTRHVRSHHHGHHHRRRMAGGGGGGGEKEHSSSTSSSSQPATSRRLYRNQLNSIDISVDENGVWLLYPNLYSDLNSTIVMKLNGGSQPEYVWNLTIDYHQLGEAFLLCGVLYGVESGRTERTHIAFAYDLYTNRELSKEIAGGEKVAFTNPFLGTVYIGYNPLYRYLYTWDNGNMLEYPLKIDDTLRRPVAKSAAGAGGDGGGGGAAVSAAGDEEEKK